MKKLIALCILSACHFNLFGQSSGLDKFIESYTKENDFNGTILIHQQAKTIYHESFGWANFEFKVPNTTDTRYKIASITKLFTSVLIMQLVEKDIIDLNQSINTYLPAYEGEGADKVSVRQLLNHTSGMVNIDAGTSLESALHNGIPLYQKPRSPDELLRDFCSGKLENNPGEVFDYNNADYIVLGKIIEKVYNKAYEQVLFENILQPLEMINTGLIHQGKIFENLANTYFFRDDLERLVPDLPVYMENWYAAGAMYSTSSDILQFSEALFGLKLLQQESLDQMFVSGLGEYGYGVWVYEDYPINNKMYKIIKRPGRIMGAQAMLFHVLNEDATIIILSNTGTTSLDNFAADLADQMIK
ncbi:serine hydrolase domain-containing protein [Negadavirga shengliensis]|uniref:Serine hydrolase domain-containing protein n=1 Tax=Negadavirga shengliensis TaxID=1389218 RepID=A0ABV9SW99_9BACT